MTHTRTPTLLYTVHTCTPAGELEELNVGKLHHIYTHTDAAAAARRLKRRTDCVVYTGVCAHITALLCNTLGTRLGGASTAIIAVVVVVGGSRQRHSAASMGPAGISHCCRAGPPKLHRRALGRLNAANAPFRTDCTIAVVVPSNWRGRGAGRECLRLWLSATQLVRLTS